MFDILIVGGGVIGLSVARELSRAGREVAVVDRSLMGREASWAGAGMIPPIEPLGPEFVHPLTALSTRLWPELSDELHESTGIDNGYHRCGGIHLPSPQTPSSAELQRLFVECDVEAELLEGQGIHDLEPSLSPESSTGVYLPRMAQVRNPRHLKALEADCQRRGVELIRGESVCDWERSSETVTAVITDQRRLVARQFVVCGGAWSGGLLKRLGIEIGVKPIRGQIVLLQTRGNGPSKIIEAGPRYLVPRRDGRLLIGSTEEDVGFFKENTATGVQSLLEFATQIVPSLKNATIEKQWAGLRPFSAAGHPLIGRTGQFSNLILATGHFRSGLTNSPGTAQVLRELICGEPISIDLSRFAN